MIRWILTLSMSVLLNIIFYFLRETHATVDLPKKTGRGFKYE